MGYIDAVRCLKCNDVIFSRHREDMRFCGCGTIAVSNGPHCCVIHGEHKDIEPVDKLYIKETFIQLRNDFRDDINKCGVKRWEKLKRSKPALAKP